MSSFLAHFRPIYDPVKRQDLCDQIRIAVALARFRHAAHVMVICSLVGSGLLVVGLFVRLPGLVEKTLIILTPVFFLLAFLLMNRIVHKEKEFKQLDWRKKAIRSADPELKELFKLPFPVELRQKSVESLEGKLKKFAEDSGKQEEVIREVVDKAVSEALRRLEQIGERQV